MLSTDDPRLDFYTIYGGEATGYDTDYVKKYDEDLNTTLIFVRRSSSSLAGRRVCSLLSAPLLSSTSIPAFDPT